MGGANRDMSRPTDNQETDLKHSTHGRAIEGEGVVMGGANRDMSQTTDNQEIEVIVRPLCG